MRFFALTVLLLSTSAMACPDLSGKYASCRSETGTSAGSSNVTVTQKLENRVTVITMTSTDNDTHEETTETYRADGKTVVARQTDPSSGMTAELATTVTCNANTSLDIKMKLSVQGEELAVINSSVTKSGKTLRMVSKSVSMGEVTNETIICE